MTIDLPRGDPRRSAARAYRDNARRLLDLERSYRDAGLNDRAKYARYMAQVAVAAARAEEVNP